MQPFLLKSNTLLHIKQVKFIHNAFSKISFQQWSTLFEPKGELYSVHEHSEKYPIISVIHLINLYFNLFIKTHLTVSQSTSPAMDCQWWLKWTIVNWLLMRRGIKKYRSHLDHSHFLAPQPVCLFSLSVLITCSCYFLFIWLIYEIF